jgi:cytoskeletal protein RodZ
LATIKSAFDTIDQPRLVDTLKKEGESTLSTTSHSSQRMNPENNNGLIINCESNSVERDPLFPKSSSQSISHTTNMTVGIPSGSDEKPSMEMEQETAPTKEEYELVTNKSSKGPKVFFGVGIFVVLAVVAIIVALLPDWGKNDAPKSITAYEVNSNQSTSNQSTSNGRDKNRTSSNSNEPALYFESDKGPFHIKIPLLSSNMTKPYTSKDEVKHDIEQLAKYVVNQAILQGINMGNATFLPPEMFVQAEGDAAVSETAAGAGAGPDSSRDEAFAGASDFETYQQEAGVIRSDYVKSNGDYVFAVLEDKILVWNLEGALLETVIMAPINVPESNTSTPYPMPEPGVEVSDAGMEAEVEDGKDTSESRSSVIWEWIPKPYIDALMLNSEGTRLTAIVSGYGVEHGVPYGVPYDVGVDTIPVIQDYKNTRVVVYEIKDDGSLDEISQADMNGYHVNSYTVGDNVHVVTKTGLRTWDYLMQPIERWSPAFQGMSDEEYEAAAILKANEIIPIFVEKVLDLYSKDGEVVLSRLAVFAESVTSEDDITDNLFGSEIANSITEVNSFDMGQADLSSSLSISTAATLQPGYWGYVYATTDWIWVADQGWRWVQDSNTYVQDTILLGFRLNGPSSSFSVYGTVPGSLLSQFSIDFHKDPDSGEEFVRAATTLNFDWGFWWRNDVAVNDQDESSRTKNQVVIMKVPQIGNGLQTGDQLEQLGSVELGKKDEVRHRSMSLNSLNFDFLVLTCPTASSLTEYHSCAIL